MSIKVRFENNILMIPILCVDDQFEVTFRNLVALEQCSYAHEPYVYSYLAFIDFLTDKDTNLLAERGIITNWVGKTSLVADTVNKLRRSVYVDSASWYSGIANRLNAYHKNHYNKTCAILKRNYFGNLWTGTATVAAILLLILTAAQTWFSYYKMKQSNDDGQVQPKHG
ncbi:hypothetical protein CARUB_v10018529mg [Capsella rubella]|uniref:Uncharacterized protein n=1 Tax=Capsella rubella TaxID=81985 RepID=R0FS52_9BRAS|nr:uncharacterized protein LOC17885815 [Capsella rubella]EOA25216.1 hypothetical protein CARUB_v10018529mg [Capsella rubella]